jgi:hypothetical protein
MSAFARILRRKRLYRKWCKRLSPHLVRYDRAAQRAGDVFFPRFSGSGAAQVPHLPEPAHAMVLDAALERAWAQLSASREYRFCPPPVARAVLQGWRA